MIEINEIGKKQIVKAWLLLGIFSLGFAGIFSILLVLARTPKIQDYIPYINFFKTCLVVHVDLSVLIWFLSFSAVLWALIIVKERKTWDNAAVIFALIATLGVIIAPFIGVANPLMNNYVPVLDEPFYLKSLAIFAIGILIIILRMLFGINFILKKNDAISYGIYYSAIISFIAFIALIWSFVTMPLDMVMEGGELYYETLFWAFGHILQFSYTLLVLVIWLWLLKLADITLLISDKVTHILLLICALPVIYIFYIFASSQVDSLEFREGFTNLMIYGGLTTLPLGIVILKACYELLFKSIEQRFIKSFLLSSIILFATGGLIGFLIDGINVVIPAHYHGSIVGVTIAFMGFALILLPKLGYLNPMPRLSFYQPIIYAAGQFMHVLGLAISGGYGGVQRKTAGAEQGLDSLPEFIGMGMMGFGGLLSVIGGFIFVIIALKSIMGKKAKA